ncbi:MAG: hypothetical protein IJZ81_00255, partial [Clostridia bacterium]|nr:hypothetical protein [Clostridia bacterium]
MDIREFKNTYSMYAPSLIWDWCAKPTAEEIDARLSQFSQMGISCVFIRPSKGLVLPYLSEDYFELIRTAARRSGKYGLKVYICDENSFSSGNGGGEITSVSDYRMRDVLKVSKKDVEKYDEIIKEDGTEAVVLRDMSRVRTSMRSPLADITDAFVTECFTNAVYDKYIRQCKRFLGIEIAGFSTQISFPENALVYSPNALKKTGISNIAECADRLLSDDKAFLEKYFSAMGESVCENFTNFLGDKCRKNDLCLFVGVDGDKNISRQAQYIKADTIFLNVDALNPDFAQFKLAESISSQLEKPLNIRLLLPSFAPCSQRYNAAAFFTAMGGGEVTYDSVAFSLSDRRKYEKNTVTVSKFAEKDISDRLSRLCFVSKNTKSDAKILLLYSPQKHDLFNAIAKKLLFSGISFHMVEEGVFEKLANIGKDYIALGINEYSHIIKLDKEYTKLSGFCGKKTVICNEGDIDFLLDENTPTLESDKAVIINRRINANDEYIFVTAPYEDTCVKVYQKEKTLFAADSSNGELYRLPVIDKECSFTLKAGKTVMLIHSSEISADIAPPFTDDIEIAPRSEKRDVPFALSSADENILPLKRVNACFGRKSYRENNIDSLHKEFYALADNETVKVKYPFYADTKNIGQVKVYIENAENLDFAELNGTRLPNLSPSEKDPRFKGTDITNLLADGKNTIALEYKKSNNYTPVFASITPTHYYSYNITSFEPVYLCGDFDCNDNSLIRLESYENDITKSGM